MDKEKSLNYWGGEGYSAILLDSHVYCFLIGNAPASSMMETHMKTLGIDNVFPVAGV